MVNGWFSHVFLLFQGDFAAVFGLNNWKHKVQVLANGILQ